MFKTICTSIALVTLTAAPAFARHKDKSIVVQAEQTPLELWSSDVTRQLERKLRYPKPMGGELPATGIAAVRFQCSPDGRPAGLVLSRKSGTHALDREAMRAIGAIKTLHPMPAGLRPDQRFEANILFAASMADYDQQIDRLRHEAARRNAWFKGDAPVIALNVGAGVPERSR